MTEAEKQVEVKKIDIFDTIKKVVGGLKEKISSQSDSTIGLDLGSFSIKAVELKKVDSQLELVNFAIIPRAKDNSPEDLSKAIKETFSQANFGSTSQNKTVSKINTPEGTGASKGIKVNVSVSGQAVIVRYIQMPQMSAQDLASAIRFEADKHIPFKLDEVVLDCQILEEKADEGKMRVLLVSAKRDFIAARIKLLSDAGLDVQLIDVDGLALINAFQAGPASLNTGTYALLNIGAQQTNINIVKDGSPCFSRDVMSAGNNFTGTIKDAMSIDLTQAEQVKYRSGKKEKELLDLIHPVLDNLATEIRLSFDYYESQFEKGIDRIYLSGGSCNLAGIDEFLTESLGVDVESWDPLNALKINAAIDKDKLLAVKNQLAIAIGLALRK